MHPIWFLKFWFTVCVVHDIFSHIFSSLLSFQMHLGGECWKPLENNRKDIQNKHNKQGWWDVQMLGNTSRLSQELSACRLLLSFRMYAPAFKAIRSQRSFASKLINLQNSSSGLLALSTFCFRRFWRRLYLNSLPFLLYNCPAKLMKPMWWCAPSNGSSAWKPLPLNYVKQILNK